MACGRTRALVNAEPFGYGPISALVQIASALPAHIEVDYLGEGHTLDLAPWPARSSAGMSDTAIVELIRGEGYDVLITCMDERMAVLGRQAGCKVVVFDALTWYWKRIPPSFADADLYLAQDFFGVPERVRAAGLVRAEVIGALGARLDERSVRDGPAIMNLGGVQNPHWSAEQSARYAQLMRAAVDVPCEVLVSSALAAQVGGRSVAPHQAARMFSAAPAAWATPGLGNLFLAAQTGTPTVWLPPANDSQARQAKLARQAGCASVIDWGQLGFEVCVDEQNGAMRAISCAVAELDVDVLRDCLQRTPMQPLRCLDRFGSDGERQAAAMIVDLVEGGR